VWGGAVPAPQKLKILRKIVHFRAKFSLVLRCIQSIVGGCPPGFATDLQVRLCYVTADIGE